MTRKYFGTDGIRGQANRFPMTPHMALKTAMATALVLQRGLDGQQGRAVIGKDTRLSGYMIEEAMCAGFVAMGMDVVLVGPIPTPGIAMLTHSLRADVGVMISASHNPFQDNGIKLFGADGYKLPDEIELKIEEKMDQDLDGELASPADLGKASRLDDAPGRYIEYIKASFPKGRTLRGLRIVVDCANGAAYKVAPQVLWELEAQLVPMSVAPNGRNINDGCGATDTALLQKRVVEEGADVGIALDGDADRLIMVDEKGARIDGDQIMALLAVHLREEGRLAGDTLVATVMSNLGLERFLKGQGITTVRTPVGDRYVVEKMREGGFTLGGEQSGHLILSDYGTTGDGLLAALHVLGIVKGRGVPVSEALHIFSPLPQILRNVRFEHGKPLENAHVRAAIARAEQALAVSGRILVRPSGTEPVIRVMAEGDDQALIESVVREICAQIENVGTPLHA